MRPNAAVRFLILVLGGMLIVAVVAPLLMSPNQWSDTSPRMYAATADNRVVAAYAGRAPQPTATRFFVSSVPLANLEQQAAELSKAGTPRHLAWESTTDSAPWSAPFRGQGQLLDLIGHNDTAGLVFDGSVILRRLATAAGQNPAERSFGDGPDHQREILLTAPAIQLPDDLKSRFSGYVIGDVNFPPVGPPQTQPAGGVADMPDAVVLTLATVDRLVLVRQSVAGSTEVLSPPCYLGLNSAEQLVILATPPTSTVPQRRRDVDQVKRESVVFIEGLRHLPGHAYRQHGDMFLLVSVLLAPKEGVRSSSERQRHLLWLKYRNGQWHTPRRLCEFTAAAALAPTPDHSRVHVLYLNQPPKETMSWKYQAVTLTAEGETPNPVTVEVKFQHVASGLDPQPISLVLAGNRLHLFWSDHGRPLTASTAPLPTDGSTPSVLTFQEPRLLGVFRAKSRNEETIWFLIFVTFVVTAAMLGLMAWRIRAQRLDVPRSGLATPLSDATTNEESADNKENDPGKVKAARDSDPVGPMDAQSQIERHGYLPAGLMSRGLALAVDLLVLVVPLYLLADHVGIEIDDLGDPFGKSPDFFRAYLLLCFVHGLYFFLCDYYFRRSLGKAVFGLRVRGIAPKSGSRAGIASRSGPLSAWALLVRNLMRVIDYPLFLVILFSPRAQRLGDMLAHTGVERDVEPEDDFEL